MSHSDHKPGVYRKGDQVRTADTAADAVKLVFDGFHRVTETPSRAPSADASEDQGPATRQPSSNDPSADGDTPGNPKANESDDAAQAVEGSGLSRDPQDEAARKVAEIASKAQAPKPGPKPPTN